MLLESVISDKVYTLTKLLLFKVNYRQELRIGFEIRKNRKHAKAEKFVKKMKKMYEKVKTTLKKIAGRNKKIHRYE